MKRTKAKPQKIRLFKLKEQVTIKTGGDTSNGVIFGYEYNECDNACGRPATKYHGWFYHVRKEGSGDESIVPETSLAKVHPSL